MLFILFVPTTKQLSKSKNDYSFQKLWGCNVCFGRTRALGGEKMVQKSHETLVNCGIKLPTLQGNGNTYPTRREKESHLQKYLPGYLLAWDMYPFPGRVPIINWWVRRISLKHQSVFVSVKIFGLLKTHGRKCDRTWNTFCQAISSDSIWGTLGLLICTQPTIFGPQMLVGFLARMGRSILKRINELCTCCHSWLNKQGTYPVHDIWWVVDLEYLSEDLFNGQE